MTYDELLQAINDKLAYYTNNNFGASGFAIALRKIVTLHKPIKSNRMIDVCELCILPIADGAFMHREYPCPTIQAIEKELA
jgi:hypothetical protein